MDGVGAFDDVTVVGDVHVLAFLWVEVHFCGWKCA